MASKKQGEAAALSRPRHRDLVDAALPALHAGYPCGEDRLELPEVEVIPLPLDPVMELSAAILPNRSPD